MPGAVELLPARWPRVLEHYSNTLPPRALLSSTIVHWIDSQCCVNIYSITMRKKYKSAPTDCTPVDILYIITQSVIRTWCLRASPSSTVPFPEQQFHEMSRSCSPQSGDESILARLDAPAERILFRLDRPSSCVLFYFIFG